MTHSIGHKDKLSLRVNVDKIKMLEKFEIKSLNSVFIKNWKNY